MRFGFAPQAWARWLPGMPTRVLVALDKFKDALTAQRAGAIVARELRRTHPDWLVHAVPITDGGDGFVRILTDAVSGEIVTVPANGPRLESVSAPIGLVDSARLPGNARALFPEWGRRTLQVAVIEMAAVNGLALVPTDARDPWQASSLGTGRLIRAAAELGARAILLGVGGSATSDLGLGALSALGYEFRAADGSRLRPPFPAVWERIVRIEGEVFDSVPPIAIACDVANPLLGPRGAAAVYGPQKGLRPEDLPRHEAEAARLAQLLCDHCGRDAAGMVACPGAGAAGGIAFGLMSAARARLVPGFELVAAWLDLDARIDAADLVITGEGRFDASSLAGKGPGEIVRRAQRAGRRVLVLAGSLEEKPTMPGLEAVAITPSGTPLAAALTGTERNLAAAVARCFP